MLAKYNCTVHSCGFISKAPGSHSIFWTTLSLLSSNKALCNLIWSLRVISMIFINCAMQPCGFKASGSHSIAYYESISKSLCICMSCILVLCLKKSIASTIFSVSLMLPHGLYRLSHWCGQASHSVGHFESYMSHSQMLGKFEYTLPAKFWRLVGCTEMLSW